jgi:hypothetical protein
MVRISEIIGCVLGSRKHELSLSHMFESHPHPHIHTRLGDPWIPFSLLQERYAQRTPEEEEPTPGRSAQTSSRIFAQDPAESTGRTGDEQGCSREQQRVRVHSLCGVSWGKISLLIRNTTTHWMDSCVWLFLCCRHHVQESRRMVCGKEVFSLSVALSLSFFISLLIILSNEQTNEATHTPYPPHNLVLTRTHPHRYKNKHATMWVCVCVYECTCVCFLGVYVCVCVYECTSEHARIYIYIYMCVCVCVCVCVCIEY